jgi:PAS domain S-box-containing protein
VAEVESLQPDTLLSQELKQVRGFLWEARAHGLDLRKEADPELQKQAEGKWKVAVAMAEARTRTAAARLVNRTAVDVWRVRSLRARDLGLGALGMLSLIGGLIWRSYFHQSANEPAKTASAGAGGDFSLVAYRFSRDAIIAADHHGDVFAMNAAAEKLLGAPASAFIGRPLERIVEVPDREVLEPAMTSARLRSGSELPVELIYRRMRGRTRKASIAILREPSKELAVRTPPMAPMARPLSPLEADSTLLADLLMHSPAPLVVLDQSGRIVHFNRACFEATGYNVGEIRQLPYWEVTMRGEAAENERRSWESGEPLQQSRVVNQIWWTERGPVEFEWSWSIFRDAQGTGRLVVAIGVTVDRGRAAEQVLEATVA